MKHPLEYSDLPHHAIPFPEIKNDMFLPKLKEAIAGAKKQIESIKTQPDSPTFQNTIEALETAGEDVDLVSGVFFNLLHAHTNDQLQALAQEIGPLLSAYGNDITLDADLFARIKTVFENRESIQLTPEQKQLLEDSYKSFVRNGALLSDKQKEELRSIDAELSKLSPQFSENVLKATNEFELWIEDTKQLAGLPESAVESAKAAAEEKGQKEKWLFTLHAPSYIPFMQYAEDRQLREKMWKAFASRSFNDEFDNQTNILNILELRQKRARLLGYKDHAHFVLEKRMAETPKRVFDFIQGLLKASVDKAKADVAEVQKFGKDNGGPAELMPWDFSFYSEKLKETKYKFSSEELRPYFQLDRVIDGVFLHASKLYDLEFKESREYPIYHEDVRVYEVCDKRDKSFVGLLYADFFPRPSKSGGAWMNTFQDQGLFKGEVRRPHVGIVCNFTKPTGTKPSLLTYDEVSTLFHEFGHGLHGLLSKCRYRSTGGTNVYWDFVELPSQIMENWIKEAEGLNLFAKHYETGELMPTHLIEKLKASEKFLAGYASLRQLTFATLDMQFHSTEASEIGSVPEFEAKILEPLQVLPRIPGTSMACSFSHIFAGGYSAGYYSYKWAEVLDADAFELFLEKGIFNPEVARRFKTEILEKGGSEPPMELYKRFRGREPDPKALLRRDGLI